MSSLIKFCVCGVTIEIAKSNLDKYPTSLLSRLIETELHVKKEDGVVIFDECTTFDEAAIKLLKDLYESARIILDRVFEIPELFELLNYFGLPTKLLLSVQRDMNYTKMPLHISTKQTYLFREHKIANELLWLLAILKNNRHIQDKGELFLAIKKKDILKGEEISIDTFKMFQNDLKLQNLVEKYISCEKNRKDIYSIKLSEVQSSRFDKWAPECAYQRGGFQRSGFCYYTNAIDWADDIDDNSEVIGGYTIDLQQTSFEKTLILGDWTVYISISRKNERLEVSIDAHTKILPLEISLLSINVDVWDEKEIIKRNIDKTQHFGMKKYLANDEYAVKKTWEFISGNEGPLVRDRKPSCIQKRYLNLPSNNCLLYMEILTKNEDFDVDFEVEYVHKDLYEEDEDRLNRLTFAKENIYHLKIE